MPPLRPRRLLRDGNSKEMVGKRQGRGGLLILEQVRALQIGRQEGRRNGEVSAVGASKKRERGQTKVREQNSVQNGLRPPAKTQTVRYFPQIRQNRSTSRLRKKQPGRPKKPHPAGWGPQPGCNHQGARRGLEEKEGIYSQNTYGSWGGVMDEVSPGA